MFAPQNHANITSRNPSTPYKRLSFPQPFSAPERIFWRVLLMYKIFFHSVTPSCPLFGGPFRGYTRDEITMQLLARDSVRSTTVMDEQRIHGTKVILNIRFPCQQRVPS